ncbi:MAG: patatin-like phospholipase family protein [Acidobacteria bacterium]|nr:patatin-like phospholipase family protein [Acidobacteriota bacterium]
MTKKRYRILSLDGGGIRGIITAVWLHALEEKLDDHSPGRKLCDVFDLIAGTSTGAILACAVASGTPAEKIIELYEGQGGSIFPRPRFWLLNDLRIALRTVLGMPLYSPRALEESLKDQFGPDTKFNFATDVLVTSYDTLNRNPVIFKSWRPKYQNAAVWEVCRASSAAPTYFPAHTMLLNDAEIPLVDGGVVANNPSVCGIAEGLKIQADPARTTDACGLKDFIVASFGTGSSTKPITIHQAVHWGPIKWLFPVIDVIFDGSQDASNYIASKLISKANYFRFQTLLDHHYEDMDKTDAVNLNALKAFADDYVYSSEVEDEMNTLVKMLV